MKTEQQRIAEILEMSKDIDRRMFKLDADWQAYIASLPCGCYACDAGVQAGHFACCTPSEPTLRLESEGVIFRSYDDGAWRWFVAETAPLIQH